MVQSPSLDLELLNLCRELVSGFRESSCSFMNDWITVDGNLKLSILENLDCDVLEIGHDIRSSAVVDLFDGCRRLLNVR